MAKIMGTASGSSASKYDVWLDVKQNSQNTTKNTSNITVALRLQRNDGYASSAYNLNTDNNSASLYVGGELKDSGTLKIDTRNSAVVTLASWTGDVSHNDAGKLTLSVKGSFSMNNTSLSSGSVSGTFKCSDIARASTLLIENISYVKPGDSFAFNISGSTAFSHKISCQIGDNTKLISEYAKGVSSGSITVPENWAAYITNAKSALINIVLGTYLNGSLIGSKRYTLKCIVVNNSTFAPSFTPSVAMINDGVPESWGVYISGISKFKVLCNNIVYKYGATLKSISIKYGTLSKNVNGSVFNVVGSGTQEIIIRVTDSRGNYKEEKKTIDVVPYSLPKIKISSVQRCDKNGLSTINGTNLRVEYSSSYAEVIANGESVNTAEIVLNYTKHGETEPMTIPVESDSPLIIGDDAILPSSGYVVEMSITDTVGKTGTFKFSITTAGIPFNIKRGGTGASFGKYSENDNELDLAWNLRVRGSLIYESVNVAETELVSEILSKVQYYNCLGIAFIRMRVKLAQTLKAGSTNVLAVCSSHTPRILTPLSVYRYGESVTEGSVIAGIRSGTGEIEIKTTSDIPAEQYIYVGGCYFTDYVNKEE